MWISSVLGPHREALSTGCHRIGPQGPGTLMNCRSGTHAVRDFLCPGPWLPAGKPARFRVTSERLSRQSRPVWSESRQRGPPGLLLSSGLVLLDARALPGRRPPRGGSLTHWSIDAWARQASCWEVAKGRPWCPAQGLGPRPASPQSSATWSPVLCSSCCWSDGGMGAGSESHALWPGRGPHRRGRGRGGGRGLSGCKGACRAPATREALTVACSH